MSECNSSGAGVNDARRSMLTTHDWHPVGVADLGSGWLPVRPHLSIAWNDGIAITRLVSVFSAIDLTAHVCAATDFQQQIPCMVREQQMHATMRDVARSIAERL